MSNLSRLTAVAALAFYACLAAEPEIPRAPLELHAPVQDKNFFLLSVAERAAAWRPILQNDPQLAHLADAKRQSLKSAIASCETDVQCYARALAFTAEEIDGAANRLRALHAEHEPVRRIVESPLRTSGLFIRYHDRSGDDLLAQAWSDAARAINNIIEVYGTGKPPRYPAIDSVAYDVTSPAFKSLVRNIARVVGDDPASLALFFQPSLSFALHLLEASHRDEAGRFEPLDAGENAPALRRILAVDWSRFPYSVIIVPGSGTDRTSFSISALSQLRCALAARRYRNGQAPLILVSGGFVHPNQPPYAEAIEMKRYLVTKLGIPPDAILADPHARHTTTNLRNAARLIYRYRVPFAKPALITTDPDHSSAIASPAFTTRCTRELGYVPGNVTRRVSPFDLEWLLDARSLHADATDPLDP